MAELEKDKTLSLQELMVSTLAMTDALAKLLIEKGLITDEDRQQWQQGTAADWALESLAIVRAQELRP